MKKVSKEFWVSNKAIQQYKIGRRGTYNQNISTYEDDCCPNKITISWEENERKVEITESDFDRALSSLEFTPHRTECDSYLKMQKLKQKLFGKTE